MERYCSKPSNLSSFEAFKKENPLQDCDPNYVQVSDDSSSSSSSEDEIEVVDDHGDDEPVPMESEVRELSQMVKDFTMEGGEAAGGEQMEVTENLASVSEDTKALL